MEEGGPRNTQKTRKNPFGYRNFKWVGSGGDRSVQLNPVVGVPLGHVGEDDAVARLEALDDLDRADRLASELHLGALGVDALGIELEDAH